jgi:hypothetical protein
MQNFALWSRCNALRLHNHKFFDLTRQRLIGLTAREEDEGKGTRAWASIRVAFCIAR